MVPNFALAGVLLEFIAAVVVCERRRHILRRGVEKRDEIVKLRI
jgi:hypothetical protein